jgi:hypothetical protein
MSDGPPQEGGCFCGALRYQIKAVPLSTGYCHCRTCQRSSGAPVMAWGTWPRTALGWIAGQYRVMASTVHRRRLLCGDCGTVVALIDEADPSWIDVALATLDAPGRFPPAYHIWCADKIAWLRLGDGLPQFADAGPDEPQPP